MNEASCNRSELSEIMSLVKGTDVGFHKNELLKITTFELVSMRKTISSYLHSKKLKKRNGKFMDVYIRICEELKRRKRGHSESDTTTYSSGNSSPKLNYKTSYDFLRKKSYPSQLFDISIPSFFNDKPPIKELKFESELMKDEEHLISNNNNWIGNILL
jgi:hypothetical protein